MVQRTVGERVIKVVRGDITDLPVEAFVHDITADCKLSSGYGGAIAARGGKAVQDALGAIGTLPTGEAVTTTAGQMKASFIIHVNGPKFHEPATETKLARAVASALARADERGVTTLAFPPLGSGLYQVPLAMSARVIVSTVSAHLRGATTLREVLLVALDEREYSPFVAALDGGS